MFELNHKVALITGASRGLGLYMARALASAGADLIITSRQLDRLHNIVEELKPFSNKIMPVELDVTQEASIAGLAETIKTEFKQVDILVNNAGCNIRKTAEHVTWKDWDIVLNTNLKGSFFVATQIAKHFMIPQQYGRIINIGSVTSVFGYAGITPYCASRGGSKQMTMSLADEWGKHGITVNCLAPGWFETKQNKVLYENKDWVNYLNDRIPLNRPGTPNDLDGAIVFLSSEESRYVTGQTLLVDGGISTGATKATVEQS